MRWIRKRNLHANNRWPIKLILDELNDYDWCDLMMEWLGWRERSRLRSYGINPWKIAYEDYRDLRHILDLYDECDNEQRKLVHWEGDPWGIERACEEIGVVI